VVLVVGEVLVVGLVAGKVLVEVVVVFGGAGVVGVELGVVVVGCGGGLVLTVGVSL
jgi:hypothetical protein